MDSDEEMSPGSNIFNLKIENIWEENMKVYEQSFTFENNYDEDGDEVKIEDKKSEKKALENDKKSAKQTDEDDDILSSKEEDEEDDILGSKAKKLLREIAARKQARSRGRRKGNKRKNNSSSNAGDTTELIKLTASAKRRIREIELETARDSKRIEEENKLVFARCDNIRSLAAAPDESEMVEGTDLEIFIKVRHQFKVSKVKTREKEEFKFIFQKVADLYGMKPTGFLLCLGDNNIKLNDTPESLNIRICDIIDCIPYDADEEVVDSHKILLKMQSNDTRKKTEIRAHKLEKFVEVMKKYADIRKLPLECLTFEFDGELIQPDETPMDLDMESGSCIDVRVSNANKAPKKAPASNAKNIPPIPVMDIVMLD